jgi:Domain of unknown function (DUF4136)
MSLTSRITSLITVIVFVCGCAPTNNLFNYEKLSSGYSKYKTYAFLPTKDTAYTKMFDKKRLETLMSVAAKRELSNKGMTLDTAHPDCFFTYKLIVNRNYAADQQQEVVYNPDVYTPAFDNDARIYTFSSNNMPVTYAGKMNIDTLREGSLVIDMIDPKARKVIWRSTYAAKTKETFEQPREEVVNEVMYNMFKKLPRK